MPRQQTISWKIGNKTVKAKVRDKLVQIYSTKRDTFIFQLDWEDLPQWAQDWILRNKKKILSDGRINGWIGTDNDGREYEIAIMAGSLLLYIINWE